MAASATFALKAGVWFRRARLFIVSPDSLGTACPLSGRNSTYRPVQILEAGSVDNPRHFRKVQWFARYFNSCLPDGVEKIPRIKGAGLQPVSVDDNWVDDEPGFYCSMRIVPMLVLQFLLQKPEDEEVSF